MNGESQRSSGNDDDSIADAMKAVGRQHETVIFASAGVGKSRTMALHVVDVFHRAPQERIVILDCYGEAAQANEGMHGFRASDANTDFELFAVEMRDKLMTVVQSRLARSRSIGLAGAEDIVQTTLVAVWRRWSRLGPPDDPIAYSVKVASRLCWRYVQEEQALRSTQAADDLTDIGMCSETDVVPLKVDIDRAISALPRRQQAVIRLFMAGASSQEIADRLEISPSTVGVHLHIARQKLRDALRNRSGE